MSAPLTPNEAERLIILNEHCILDTLPEQEFDDIVSLAARECGTPIAAITLIDEHRQWLKASVGIDFNEIPREMSFCAHTILQNDLMIIPDTREDARFASNPMVTGEAHIRFYAGAPLVTEDGYNLGSLCVTDTAPRILTPGQEAGLLLLARQTSSLLRAHRGLAERERLVAEREHLISERERASVELMQSRSALDDAHAALRAVLDSAPIILYTADAYGIVTLSEGNGLAALGLVPSEAVGHSVFEYSGGIAKHEEDIRRALSGETVSFDAQIGDACLHTIVRPIKGANGASAGIIGVCFDVTDRKRAEEKVQDHAVILELQEWQKQELERVNAELETMATTDGLTGICNHRAFQERLSEEVGRATRYSLPLSLIMMDVDKFKQYNDQYGHPEGDGVLRIVAHILQDCARDIDLVARYGGEEFVLILPQTNIVGAAALAERLRAAVENYSWPSEPVTASFGVSSLRPDDLSKADLINRADAMMYRSKIGGRNQVNIG